MDLQQHIEKYKNLRKGQLPTESVPSKGDDMLHFEIEESQTANLSYIIVDTSSNLSIRENLNRDFLRKDQIKKFINPFENNSQLCQLCYRLLCLITLLIVIGVVYSIIAYR
jgi:hypothetical protein